jgi:hypothetical protein
VPEYDMANEGLEMTLDTSAPLEECETPAAGSSSSDPVRWNHCASPPGASDTSSKAALWKQKSLWVDYEGDGMISLEEAFELHCYNFDSHADGTMGMEELLIMLERCNFFDDFLTIRKVRVYLLTMRVGCNHVVGVNAQFKNSLAYPDFEKFLHWLADMKAMPYEKCVVKVIGLSAQLCDTSSSLRRKLEVLFDTYGVRDPGWLYVFEFSMMCSKAAIYEKGKFSTGDVHKLFHNLSGTEHHLRGTESVDFEGFLGIVVEVGRLLGVGPKVFFQFGDHCDHLKADDSMMQKLRSRLRGAAMTLTGANRDWEHFFHEQNPSGTGSLTWPEFHHMCRHALHLNVNDNHLRTLFCSLDEDLSGEISIEELVEFVADDHEKELRGHRTNGSRASPYSAGFMIDVTKKTWGRI